jgi:putative Ca2+/H+ antiporter (TMEM165/GDT1 family)
VYITTRVTEQMASSIGLKKIIKFLFIYLLFISLFNAFNAEDARHDGEVAKRDNDHEKHDDHHSDKKEHHDHHDDDDDDKDSESREDKDSREFSAEVAKQNFGFIHAFFASLSVIVVSEIGDKTFFIAAIMAMKHPRMIVYTGAMFALGLMTFLSALLGNVITKVIPKTYTYYASSILFAIFGFKMLYEGWKMSADEHGDEEFEEAQENIHQVEETNEDGSVKQNIDIEAGNVVNDTKENKPDLSRKLITRLRKYVSPIFLQGFILTFLAEWGDRSQISTIILGARENILGTIAGGTLGHGLCTGAAVLGGRLIAQHISIRTVTLCGAFVFLFFAFSAIFIGPGSD